MGILKKHRITVIGAGLAGCYLAILLAKRGFEVEIFERDYPFKSTTGASKRSFNLSFYERGVRAFKAAQLWKTVKRDAVSLKGTISHPSYSPEVFSEYSFKGKPYLAIGRAKLLEILLKEVKKYPNIKINFGTTIGYLDMKSKKITLKKGGKIFHLRPEVVIGADGVNSVVREAILKRKKASVTKDYAPWTYKEVHFDQKLTKILHLKNNAMHVWARKDVLMTAFPNRDGSVTAMLTLPTDKNCSFDTLKAPLKMRVFLDENFASLKPAVAQIKRSILYNPEGRLLSVTAPVWYDSDFAAIVGDAAHGALPFFGQGTSAAFEDCLELASLIDEHGTDWKKIFPIYQENRKKHADVLVSLSAKNINRFLRHKEADFEAIHDRLEFILHKRFPIFWKPPLYIMMANYTDQFGDILNMHLSQRRKALFTGVTLAAALITGIFIMKGLVMGFSTYVKQAKFNLIKFFVGRKHIYKFVRFS